MAAILPPLVAGTETGQATVPVAKNLFVIDDGGLARIVPTALGEQVHGVTIDGTDNADESVTVQVSGEVEVLTDAALSLKTRVMTAIGGKAVAYAGNAYQAGIVTRATTGTTDELALVRLQTISDPLP
jgi:hypothetical protein